MRGQFTVRSVDQSAPQPCFSGNVDSGTLKAGMESRVLVPALVIAKITDISRQKTISKARSGDQVILELRQVAGDIGSLAGQTLEFEDSRSIPLEEQVALDVGTA